MSSSSRASSDREGPQPRDQGLSTPLESLFDFFVRESNRIEGINRDPLPAELSALGDLLDRDHLMVVDLVRFVSVMQPDARLRNVVGRNVYVGDHVPPPGGPEIELELMALLSDVAASADPWLIHQRYEHLHPFTDGNGRSGRALWLWQMVRQRRASYAVRMGFLHLFYYQSLSAWHPAESGADDHTGSEAPGSKTNPKSPPQQEEG